MKLTTIDTPDGPFTFLASDGAVLAAGWTASTDAVLGRLRPGTAKKVAQKPATDPELAPVVAAVAAYYQNDFAALDTIEVGHQGTEFQLQGWAALRKIRPGRPLSYTEFAAKLGRPGAIRAAAGICARNAPALFVPCHRVIRNDGSLGGFAWGLPVKQSLLDREAGQGR